MFLSDGTVISIIIIIIIIIIITNIIILFLFKKNQTIASDDVDMYSEVIMYLNWFRFFALVFQVPSQQMAGMKLTDDVLKTYVFVQGRIRTHESVKLAITRKGFS